MLAWLCNLVEVGRQDCVFGVISLIWLTLASVDSEETLDGFQADIQEWLAVCLPLM